MSQTQSLKLKFCVDPSCLLASWVGAQKLITIYDHWITIKWFTYKLSVLLFWQLGLMRLNSSILGSRFKHYKSWNNYLVKGKVRKFLIEDWLVSQTDYEQDGDCTSDFEQFIAYLNLDIGFLEPRLCPEGWLWNRVCPTVLKSRTFLGIGWLIFSEIFLVAIYDENDQKWSKTEVLNFSGISCD